MTPPPSSPVASGRAQGGRNLGDWARGLGQGSTLQPLRGPHAVLSRLWLVWAAHLSSCPLPSELPVLPGMGQAGFANCCLRGVHSPRLPKAWGPAMGPLCLAASQTSAPSFRPRTPHMTLVGSWEVRGVGTGDQHVAPGEVGPRRSQFCTSPARWWALHPHSSPALALS